MESLSLLPSKKNPKKNPKKKKIRSLILPVENPGTELLLIEVTSKMYSLRKSMFGINKEGLVTLHSFVVPSLQPYVHLTLHIY